MNKVKENLLLHPVRMRIILAVAGRRVTAQQLANELPDIPQATLYRNIKTLAAAGILAVVQERRVRNTLEKTYALPDQDLLFTVEDLKEAQPEDYVRLVTQYLGLLLAYSVRYIGQGDVDFARDNVVLRSFPLYLSPAEAQGLGQAVDAALLPYVKNEASPERRRFIIGLVSVPDVVGAPLPTGSAAENSDCRIGCRRRRIAEAKNKPRRQDDKRTRKEATMNTMDDLKQEAQHFLGQLVAGDFAGARRLFNPELAEAFPEARLRETWLQTIGQAGPFENILACLAVERQENRIVTVSCQFGRVPLDFGLSFNHAGQITGLTRQLGPATSPYNPPAYVDPTAFHELEVTVGSGEWVLPASLSLPHGTGHFPAVVLVHGSGPQDRDETIGPNKPFRDLAWGLASQGVAVLRYEKRTKAHARQFTPEITARLTVQEEVVDDALAAVHLLRQTPGIDPGRIYVLGHSLGGTVAPRIGRQDPSIAGLVIIAGMTRPFENAILDQYTYLYSLSGRLTEIQKGELEQLRAKVARVKDAGLSAAVPAKDLPLGVPPAYWLDLRGYQPAEVAKSLVMRIFVLQAGRDYQVTTKGDFPAWQRALGEKSNVTLKVYPRLSHELIAGEGPATPQDYLVEGHVSAEVVQDIAAWIRK